jgi:hypothetical protein
LEFHATFPHVRHLLRSLLVAGDRYRGQRIPPRPALGLVGAVGREHAHLCRRDGLRPDVQGMHRRTNQAAQPRHERVLELGEKSEDAHRAVANRSNAMPRRA